MSANISNERRIKLERAITRALIRHLLERGWTAFRTWDGGEFVYPKSETETMQAVFNLDEVSLRFIPTKLAEKKSSDRKGYAKWANAADDAEHGVLLVLGNGEDILSDWNYTEGDPDGFNKAMNEFDSTKVDAGSEDVSLIREEVLKLLANLKLDKSFRDYNQRTADLRKLLDIME